MPILPLGNLSLGARRPLYAAVALAWLFLFWRAPRVGLVFVAGPLLAPLAALGLVPLAAIVAGGPSRRAAAALGAVAAARARRRSAATLPLRSDLPPRGLALAGVARPVAAAEALGRRSRRSARCSCSAVVARGGRGRAPVRAPPRPWASPASRAALLGASVAAAPRGVPWPFVLTAWLRRGDPRRGRPPRTPGLSFGIRRRAGRMAVA